MDGLSCLGGEVTERVLRAGLDFANEIKKRESKVHVLVNNSGATWGAPYDKYVPRISCSAPKS